MEKPINPLFFEIENTLGFCVGNTRRVLAKVANQRFAEAGHDISIEQAIIMMVLLKFFASVGLLNTAFCLQLETTPTEAE